MTHSDLQGLDTGYMSPACQHMHQRTAAHEVRFTVSVCAAIFAVASVVCAVLVMWGRW